MSENVYTDHYVTVSSTPGQGPIDEGDRLEVKVDCNDNVVNINNEFIVMEKQCD